jgi:hypothetical protein
MRSDDPRWIHMKTGGMFQGSSGAQERKRAAKATPSPDGGVSLTTSLIWAGVVAPLAVWLVWAAAEKVAIGCLGAVAILLLVLDVWQLTNIAREVQLLLQIRSTYGPRGIRCLLVHSASPNWEPHITGRWMPRLHGIAATLDWSKRADWGSSLETRLFKRYLAPYNFNPAVLVFRGFRRPLAFRFYEAFHQAKHGRTQYLEALEDRMFSELGV